MNWIFLTKSISLFIKTYFYVFGECFFFHFSYRVLDISYWVYARYLLVCVIGLIFHFIFFKKNKFYWLCYYSCRNFSPLAPCTWYTPFSAEDLPLNSCPWVMHISYLTTSFPILFLTSPCLFCTFQYVLLNPCLLYTSDAADERK